MSIKRFVLVSILTSSTIFANTLNIRSIESNFTQNITNDQNAKVTYTGKMYATQSNNQALWEYNSPIVKKIYYQKGKLVIIEPELEQVIYAKLDKIPNVLQLLKTSTRINANTLQTKFNNLTYTIQTKGNTILHIRYTDEMQNKVVITFQNEKVNQHIANSKFTYKIPAGYDILEQ